MKICFYCDSIYSYGGVQRVLTAISSALASNHEVTILTLDPVNSKVDIFKINPKIKVEHIVYGKLPLYEFIFSKLYAVLYKKILPHTRLTTYVYGRTSFPTSRRSLLINHITLYKYDIVVAVHVFLSFHLASIVNEINSKTIGWMHSSYEAFFSGMTAYIKNQENRFKYQMINLDQIVVLSESDKCKFQSKLNVPTTRIYNPITVTSDSLADYSSKKFLAVGRLVQQKGFDILLKAFVDFCKINSEWTLTIVGDGPEKHNLNAIIEDNNISNRVSILPFTPNIEHHYKASSVFILSSRLEGFGLVLLEAMQHRLPLIVSDIPISKELFTDKEFMYMFKNGDSEDLTKKMHDIINHPDLKRIGDLAYDFSHQFKIDDIILAWETLLKSTITI